MTRFAYNHARPSRVERELAEPEQQEKMRECFRCDALNDPDATHCWKCTDPLCC